METPVIKEEHGNGIGYATIKQAAEAWNVSARWVNYLCINGRIEGAIRKGKIWLIPVGTKKPEDKRRCKNNG